MRHHVWRAIVLCLWTAAGALAQQTSGNVTGRILDQQGAAIPGATVTARNTETGLSRSEVSDAEGVFRLNALPVGTYDITAELQGFTAAPAKQIPINVSQTITLDFSMRVASLTESVTVTVSATCATRSVALMSVVAEMLTVTPLISTRVNPFNSITNP